MTKRWMTKMTLVVMIGAAPLALSSASAGATSGPAPGTGFIGGCNMLRDLSMGTVPMVRDAPQGNAGMFIGVAASGDPYCS
jgi:hypothetical protein